MTDLCEVCKYLHDMHKTDKNIFFYSVTAYFTREQFEAGYTLCVYSHNVKLVLTPSSQHLEQPT